MREDVPAQAVRLKNKGQIPASSTFCFIQALCGLNGVC